MTDIIHITPDMAPALERFWEEAFPLRPMTPHLLRERIFAAPDSASENMLAMLDDSGSGRLIAISLLSPPGGIDDPDADADAAKLSDSESSDPSDLAATAPPRDARPDRVGGIRWFGVHPIARGQGLGKALMEETCSRLRAAGATVADFLITPPHYLQPGVDVRQTSVISWLLHRGFEHYRTNFNMTVDLQRFRPPAEEAVFDPDAEGYRVRRAAPEDADAFRNFARGEWTDGWAVEGALGLRNNPVSLFVATRPAGASPPSGATEGFHAAPVAVNPARVVGGEEIVGFAVYEANQGLGCFGPTGVDPRHQGRGLGKKLLFATLMDMKRLGRRESEIGWVGPVEFYHRACGATLGPVFWGMRKRLG